MPSHLHWIDSGETSTYYRFLFHSIVHIVLQNNDFNFISLSTCKYNHSANLYVARIMVDVQTINSPRLFALLLFFMLSHVPPDAASAIFSIRKWVSTLPVSFFYLTSEWALFHMNDSKNKCSDDAIKQFVTTEHL